MIDICPTIDAEDENSFREQMERVAHFVHRVHIDLGDGVFTPNKLVPIDQVWWPGGVRADLHVMYQDPTDFIPALMALGPQLIIVQAEADGDFLHLGKHLHEHGIEAGVALLPGTNPEIIRPGLEYIDHVLIFSGNLGHQGGSHADLGLLEKVQVIKSLKSSIEIGWDGGVDDININHLVDGGIEVINAGGYIQGADNPAKAFQMLQLSVD
jgi:ribulose-phosphate 3-epimerase